MLNLSWITRQFFPKRSAKSINYGSCFNWAYMAYLLVDGTDGRTGQLVTFDENWPCGWHAGVKFGNLFYDSESPLGVRNWENLKSFKRVGSNRLHVIQQSKEEFRRYWSGVGLNSNLLPVVEELVRKYKTLGIASPVPEGRSNLFR